MNSQRPYVYWIQPIIGGIYDPSYSFFFLCLFLIDSSALIPHIIYFKGTFLSIKTLICLLPILHFTGNTQSSNTKPHCLLTSLVHFYLLFHSPSSTMTLSLPLNSSCVFFFIFVSVPKLFSLGPNFKMVEIQVRYIGEKGVSLMYLKLKKNSRIDFGEFPQIRIYLPSLAICFKWASACYLVELLQMVHFDDNLKK